MSLQRNYDRAAWFYQTSAAIYSLNRITASKRHQLKHIRARDKVVYLGVGTGEDAVMAASVGAEVTCVDVSSKMLSVLKRKLTARNLTAELICSDAKTFQQLGHFDVCCGNYFFNVFREEDAVKMMKHAIALIKPDGKLLIADVALGQGNLIYRMFNLLYRKFAMLSFSCLGLVPPHRDHDYRRYIGELGWDVSEVQFFRLFPGGPVVYQSIAAQRKISKRNQSN